MSLVKGLIGIAIGVIVFANVFMYILKNTSTSKWTGGEVALWSVMGLAGIIGLVYGVFATFGLV